MSSRSFSVLKVSIREYLVGLASWVEEIIEEADASTQETNCSLALDVSSPWLAIAFTTFSFYALRTTLFIDENTLPPILPNALVKTRHQRLLRGRRK